MTIGELDTSWALTTEGRNYLRWELIACDEICGVFASDQDDVLTVLFDGDGREFAEFASTLVLERGRQGSAQR
jgi:hypothetical protein